MIQPVEHAELEYYVPHKGPMFLLSRLVHEDLSIGMVRSEVDISPQALFFRPEMDGVPVWVAFEYMAQTIGVLSGRQRAEDGQQPTVGFIMGVRDFDCQTTVFPRDSRLVIEVSQVFRDGPVVSFGCRVFDACGAGTVLASAMVNAIEVTDIELNAIMEASNG